MTTRPGHLLFVAAAFLVAPLWATSANAHGVTLKVHHALPADSPFHTQFLVPWTQKVEKESGGRLQSPALSRPADGRNCAAALRPGEGWRCRYRLDRCGLCAGPLSGVRGISATAHGAQCPGGEPGAVGVRATERPGKERIRRGAPACRRPAGRAAISPAQPTRPVAGRPQRAQDRRAPQRLPAGSWRRWVPLRWRCPQTRPVQKALSTGSVDGALLPWEAVSALESGALVKYHTELAPQNAVVSIQPCSSWR